MNVNINKTTFKASYAKASKAKLNQLLEFDSYLGYGATLKLCVSSVLRGTYNERYCPCGGYPDLQKKTSKANT